MTAQTDSTAAIGFSGRAADGCASPSSPASGDVMLTSNRDPMDALADAERAVDDLAEACLEIAKAGAFIGAKLPPADRLAELAEHLAGARQLMRRLEELARARAAETEDAE